MDGREGRGRGGVRLSSELVFLPFGEQDEKLQRGGGGRSWRDGRE